MKFVNLKATPLEVSEIKIVNKHFDKPYLPIKAQYLTRLEIVLKDGRSIALNAGEYINPDGDVAGFADISTETHMIDRRRIAKIEPVVLPGTDRIILFSVCLSDGGAYLLSEGCGYLFRMGGEKGNLADEA